MKEIIIEYCPYLLGGYELISRIIPTKKNYSLVHGILQALLFASGKLNRREKKLNDKLPIIFVLSVFLFSCSVTKRIECVSQKSVQVTFINPNGNTYSVNVPYCDTIRLKKNIDTTAALKMHHKQSEKMFNNE